MAIPTSSRRPGDPQLAQWHDEVDAIRLEARSALAGLSDSQLAWRPAPGKWSILECLDHLIVTARAAAVHLKPAIAKARADGKTGAGPFGFGLLGGWFVGVVGPNPRRPMTGPAVFAPRSDLDSTRVLPDVETCQEEIQALFLAADGLDLGRIRARSAASGLIRNNLAAWFAGTVAHERRHLQQIARIKAHEGFPPH